MNSRKLVWRSTMSEKQGFTSGRKQRQRRPKPLKNLNKKAMESSTRSTTSTNSTRARMHPRPRSNHVSKRIFIQAVSWRNSNKPLPEPRWTQRIN
jgi:hypothetical protein